MKLKIIGSNSRGNAYLLEAADCSLLIECGVRFDKVKQAIGYNLSKLVGCVVTHEHGDHACGIKDLTYAGVNVYATAGTCEELLNKWKANPHRVHPRHTELPFSLGPFRIIAFKTIHDTKEPCGFLIHHPECGVVLFLTDTVYSLFTFKGLNNIIVEANYDDDILEDRRMNGGTIKMLRDRVIESHMSIKNCKDLLAANDLSKVNNIVLIHLSDGHSHAENFKKEVEQLTGKRVHIADAGMTIDHFETTPF
jgi:phosphoribosyl 1,2-cyclic phosphodiesterase